MMVKNAGINPWDTRSVDRARAAVAETKMTKLTPSQQKTLDYIKKNGRIMLGCLSSGGYSVTSAEAMIRKGVLIEVLEPRTTTFDDGHTESWNAHFADLPKGKSK
jgi:hypothetical protein